MNTRNPQPTSLTMRSIREAHARIRDKIQRTPVMTSETLDAMAGKKLYFKCENLQKAGAFKARGATNAAERERIIAALNACAGNQSRAAKLLGIPRRTFLTKLDGYGIPRPKKGSAGADQDF